jgi:hypothetical protein
MRNSIILSLAVAIGGTVAIGIHHSDAVIADQVRPDLAAIFNGGNYQQYVDRFGTVSRTAFDATGRRIGTQVGTHRPGEPNGMVIEMTYLEPDEKHPRGQAFDDAAKPVPLHDRPN